MCVFIFYTNKYLCLQNVSRPMPLKFSNDVFKEFGKR